MVYFLGFFFHMSSPPPPIFLSFPAGFYFCLSGDIELVPLLVPLFPA